MLGLQARRVFRASKATKGLPDPRGRLVLLEQRDLPALQARRARIQLLLVRLDLLAQLGLRVQLALSARQARKVFRVSRVTLVLPDPPDPLEPQARLARRAQLVLPGQLDLRDLSAPQVQRVLLDPLAQRVQQVPIPL